jgi:DNA-binding NarL/FixJ family response regulator
MLGAVSSRNDPLMVDSPPSELRAGPAALECGPQLQAITQTASRAVGAEDAEHHPDQPMDPTGSELLERLPEEAIAGDPPAALVAAWIGWVSGASNEETERWLAAAERADEQLGRALELLGIDGMLVQRAHALLLLGSVRQGRGDLPGARALVEQARELVERLADPGPLSALLEQANRNLGLASRRWVGVGAPLTKREVAVLRLLPISLSAPGIGRELYVSVSAVRSRVQAIFRKLEVTSRAEAVARARHLRVVPGSTPTDQQRCSATHHSP